jgi:SAM-dependent methyltransferase
MIEFEKMAYSFVVDADPLFAYQGWHLAHSLIQFSDTNPQDIYVQFTPAVDIQTVRIFEALGCNVSRLEKFGDGRYCNKIAQWSNVRSSKAEHFVFLDTDMILVGDCREHLISKTISAKIVDLANPPVETLDEIMTAAGFPRRPTICEVDANQEETYNGNCNGGMYSVPRLYADRLFMNWRRWALWLLDNMGPLRRAVWVSHVDQVSFCLAIHELGVPFERAPSNANYYVHFAGDHKYFDTSRPISLLHYHNESINMVGALEPRGAVTAQEIAAVGRANDGIARHFSNRLFWDMRYAHFIDRGSGVGSRGQNLEYKRKILQEQGAEQARSVLDVGCGDLEVVKPLALQGYIGVDQSNTTLEIARRARPDWTFLPAPAISAPAAELVLCFEVLIHQETLGAYLALIKYVAEKTERILLVSGYEEETESIRQNPMLFYYEPLSLSLARTERFESITIVGRHSDVVIFRCAARSLRTTWRRFISPVARYCSL